MIIYLTEILNPLTQKGGIFTIITRCTYLYSRTQYRTNIMMIFQQQQCVLGSESHPQSLILQAKPLKTKSTDYSMFIIAQYIFK